MEATAQTACWIKDDLDSESTFIAHCLQGQISDLLLTEIPLYAGITFLPP